MDRFGRYICAICVWAAVQSSANAAPDLDCDGDVDRDDFVAFLACAAGPGVSLAGLPACQKADLDGDGDADLADLAALQACFHGPGVSTDLTCACRSAFVANGTLHVNDTNASGEIALRLRAGNPGLLDVDFDDDGAADYSFSRVSFLVIQVDALGGSDVVRIDESNGVFTDVEQTMIDGGAGDDILLGGAGPELLIGDAGNDLIDSGPGEDLVLLGAGDDVFQWYPGDGGDVLDGEGGADTLRVIGDSTGESIDVSSDDDWLRVLRNAGAAVLDADGVEQVDIQPLEGADQIAISDLTATRATRVLVDLASSLGGGDAQSDRVTIHGSADAEAFSIVGVNAAPQISRAGIAVRVERGEPSTDQILIAGGPGDHVDVNGSSAADAINIFPATMPGAIGVTSSTFAMVVNSSGIASLALNGLGGADTISSVGNIAGLGIAITYDGGEGDDTLLGTNASDLLIGGNGNDLIDGNMGADTAFMGPGNDTFQWDPGDGNDVIDGQAGSDTLRFNGANASEVFDASANGGRLRFTRNVANIVLDANGVELLDLRALGGADVLTVNDLVPTDITAVVVNFASSGGGGDGAADVVNIAGTAAGDAFAVTGVNGAAQVSRPGLTVRVEQGEAANDSVLIAGGAADLVTVSGTESADTLVVTTGLVAGALRVLASNFAIPVDTSGVASLVLRGLGGADSISGTGNVAATGIPVTFDGGEGDDTLLGTNAGDVLIGGNGSDLIDGNQGNDTALMGAGDDVFQWDPGDGSDVVEGQADHDTLRFNGSNIGEVFDAAANGGRLRFTRNVANIVMDLDGVEQVILNALGGADSATINDLAGTAVTDFLIDLANAPGSGVGDGQPDTITMNGTPADDTVVVVGDLGDAAVFGLGAAVAIHSSEPASDRLIINLLAGDDTLDASALAANAIQLTGNGGADSDVLIGGAGADTLFGGDGDDVLIGGPGLDLLDGGPGDNVVIQD